MERREHPRLPISLPCEVELLRNGVLHEGLTQNLSRTGALIEVIAPMADFIQGDNVTVRIQLPLRALFEQKCMTCTGVLARVDDSCAPARTLAVEIRTVVFESAARMLLRPEAFPTETAGETNVH
jgi:hypothetical protein